MEILECVIIKLYTNGKREYYLVTKEDLKKYRNGIWILPFITAMKYKKYLIEYVKSYNNKQQNKKIKLVKEN